MTNPKHQRRLGRVLFALLVLGLFALLLWWTFFRTIEVIETEAVRRGNLEESITALGTLQPYRYVDVGAQVSGQIRHIGVKAGDVVAKGDLLLEIDPAVQEATVRADRAALESLRAQLAEQEALHDFAAQKVARQKILSDQNAASVEDYQSAHTELRVAKARMARLRAQIEGARFTLEGNETLLSYTRIFAPMDGSVITLDASEGQTLNANYQTPKLLRLANLERMTVWANVSEADVGRISEGMAVYFTTLGLMDESGEPRRWTSHVRQVLPAPPASSDSGETGAGKSNKVVSYIALFDVDNKDRALMPQMSAKVFFVSAAARDVLLAPLAHLTATDQADIFHAQVLQDGKPQSRTVKIGTKDRLYAEVLAGLAENEALVTGSRRQSGSERFRW